MEKSDTDRRFRTAVWIFFWIVVDCGVALVVWHAATLAGVVPALRVALVAAFFLVSTATRFVDIPFINWENTEDRTGLIILDLGFSVLYLVTLVLVVVAPFLSPRDAWLGISFGVLEVMLVWWLAGMSWMTLEAIRKRLNRKQRHAYLDKLAAAGVIRMEPVSEEERARNAARDRKNFRPTLWQMWLAVLAVPALASAIAWYLGLFVAAATSGSVVLLGVLGSNAMSGAAAGSLWPVSRGLRLLEKRFGTYAFLAGVLALLLLCWIAVDALGAAVAAQYALVLATALGIVGLARLFLPLSIYPSHRWVLRICGRLGWCALLLWVADHYWPIGAYLRSAVA